MLDFDEALQACVELGRSRAAREEDVVSLESAVGRVLAEDVRAIAPVPRNDYSAMDGYAVRSIDVSLGRALPVEGESRPGRPLPEFRVGTAMRIFTGGALPEGADAVIMQENALREGELVEFTAVPRPYENVRRAGEDLAAGELGLGRGHRLDGAKVSLLAMLERDSVRVWRRPRVALLCTGDELRPPSGIEDPEKAKAATGLAESNSYGLASLMRAAGAEPLARVIVKDEPGELERALEFARQNCDAIVTVGGASVGDHDWARPVLSGLGASILVPKVRMKPGKPFFLADFRGVPIIGLPGNPSSAHITFTLLGVPLLRALSGAADVTLPRVRIPLVSAFRQKAGRRNFLRARLVPSGVEILENQASGAGTSLAWADALVVIPEETTEVPVGALVDVIFLGGLG